PARSLDSTSLHRGGATARQLYRESGDVEIETWDDTVQLRFSMGSKGGGVTVVHLNIGSSDFAAMLETMVEADRQAAMSAMSAELARQVGKQPLHDVKTASEARTSVLNAAHDKYIEAPAGNDEAEGFIYKQVEKLISELEAHEDGEEN